MPGAADLYEAAADFLDACMAALDDSVAGRPSVGYVTFGTPAWDSCDQLIVHAPGITEAMTLPLMPPLQPGHRVTQQGAVLLVAIAATILRCVPALDETSGAAPSPEQHDKAAQVVLSDYWSILNGVRAAKRNATLFAPKEREMFFDPAVPLNPQGGLAGWQFNVRVQLDGYDATA